MRKVTDTLSTSTYLLMANYSEPSGPKETPVRFSEELENFIAMFVTPTVVFFGLFGNILNIIIILKKRTKLSSALTLLCSLSIMDTMVLAVQVPYIIFVYVEPQHTTLFTINAYFVCYVRYPVSNAGLTAVAWLSAAMSFDRFASVMNVQRLRSFQKCHAKATAAAIVLIACALNSSRVLQFEPIPFANATVVPPRRRRYCRQTQLLNNTLFGIVSDYLSGLLNTLLPTSCMLLFGGIIVYKLVKIKRQRRVLFVNESAAQAAVDDAHEQDHNRLQVGQQPRCGEVVQQKLHRADRRISLATKMVVATIGLFVLSGLPSFCLTTASAIFGYSIYENDAVNCVKHISNLMIIINASFCFLLYCCTCSKYRLAVRRLLHMSRRQQPCKNEVHIGNLGNSNSMVTATNRPYPSAFTENRSYV